MMDDTLYMHAATGGVDTRDGWWYQTDDGETVNAADRGEVVPVRWDIHNGDWVEEE